MLVDRKDRNARYLISLLAIFIFATTIIYDDLSTPTFSGDSEAVNLDVNIEGYRVVYSASTADKKYFFIDFVYQRAINPNIIPHPFLDETWVIVAQRHDPENSNRTTLFEITCNAAFRNGTLRCLNSSSSLPIKAESWDMCEGEVEMLNLSRGPHDARVFYGPGIPYTIYGSNSQFTCFGQFIQDFRSLIDWGNTDFPDTKFKSATELQRPPPYGTIEKNWFVFWDQDGQIYAHYDMLPKRVFAKLEIDGSVGEDLAPQAALAGDDRCIEKYAPQVEPVEEDSPDGESIHQATNSLSVTLCKRSDPSCVPDEGNTFILTIFQYKRYYYFHSVYDPYVMLFEQKAPFKIHGISTKPFWIHGRWKPNEVRSWNQTEMFYITSMSWKSNRQKYHGYVDDVVFLGFGIEDSMTAGIDVVVGDLLMDLGHC
ncbi:hypothetical protein B0J14DRAFT_614139 [Halenospora varia]|nr:hypothetical protein B0J14DRAFT_614139 [Halenospora varia]